MPRSGVKGIRVRFIDVMTDAETKLVVNLIVDNHRAWGMRNLINWARILRKYDVICPSPFCEHSTSLSCNLDTLFHQNSRLIINHFWPPGVPVFPSIGNHESVPVNEFPEINSTMKFNPNWLYNGLADIYKTWLPGRGQQHTLRNGGYYTVRFWSRQEETTLSGCAKVASETNRVGQIASNKSRRNLSRVGTKCVGK